MSLQRQVRTWGPQTTVRTDEAGRFSFRLRLKAPGRLAYRLVHPADDLTARHLSPPVRIHVLTPGGRGR